MSRKKDSSKAKLKKALIQEQIAREKASKAVIDAANEVKDIFDSFKGFKDCKRSAKGLHVELFYSWAENLPSPLLDWAFQLTKVNVQSYYEACQDWGWSDKVKRKELEDAEGRYIYALDKQSELPLGFALIRFMLEDTVKICYVWELQVTESHRRKGLGSYLMQLIELLAWKLGMDKVILTSFKDNPASANFYKKKMRYLLDETDPSFEPDDDFEDPGYEILSKTRRIIHTAPSPSPSPSPSAVMNSSTNSSTPS